MIDAQDAQTVLNQLSYYDGPIDGDLKSEASVKAIKMFQMDTGLSVDGIIGEKQTSPALERYAEKLEQAPEGFQQARRWRMTCYYVESEADYNEQKTIPVYDTNKKVIAMVGPRLFAMMSLEGTGKMLDGRLLNVTGSYVSVDAATFEPVRLFAVKNNWTGKKYGYAGLVVENDLVTNSDRVTKAFAFYEVSTDKVAKGYGTTHGIPLDPFRTVAADIGAKSSSEPKFKGQGGLVPIGTRVWVLELVGLQLPDGTVHDGWVVASDTGGAIYGAHFDLFVGEKSLFAKMPIPGRGHIWFEGLEDRIPANYTYGL